MRYRRAYVCGAIYFFTVNLRDRTSNLLIEEIDTLRGSFQKVKQNHPYKINAAVILPNHLHMIMTLPTSNSNYLQRLNLIKGEFSKQIMPIEAINPSRKSKKERGVWQRRFWEHLIRDEQDYIHHVNYIHYNPVKHGYVTHAIDWPYSSLHQFIKSGEISK